MHSPIEGTTSSFRRLNILVIVDPNLPTPPGKYGGIERAAHLSCEVLRKAGHNIHLIAAPGSRSYGGGLTIHHPPGRDRPSRAFRKILFQFLALREVRGIDIVINHGRLDYLWAIFKMRVPLVCWFHNPVCQSELDYVFDRRPDRVLIVGVSNAQMNGLKTRDRLQVVHNAVDTEVMQYAKYPVDPPYVVFLGRLTKNKGVHLAIAAAARAGIRLVIAGNVPDETEDLAFFEREVKPWISTSCEWIGMVDDEQKRALLQGATAMLFPIQWAEPNALVVLESLACGTPVIAWRMASTPEVLRHGITGFLCDSIEEMVDAIREAGTLDRLVCRQEAENRFSPAAFQARAQAMLDKALEIA
jgi:glycosyltransferase involved in cell wall biosynthesis